MTSEPSRPPYSAPHRALLWSEYLRASADTAAFCRALPGLERGPAGDGHHVLVLPGLLGDDRSTILMRHLLRLRGYWPHGWRLGRNLGPTRRVTDGLRLRLTALYERSGQPVSLIGQSLGGILARELARLMPGQVRCTITVGSPFRITVYDPPRSTHAGPILQAFRPWHTDLLDHADREEDRPRLAMPATSIYSRVDGVVPWQACQDLPGPLRENIEVTASHFGMGVHPEVLEIILNRLAQPVGAWQPYHAAPVTPWWASAPADTGDY